MSEHLNVLSILTKGKIAKKIIRAKPDKKPSIAPFTNVFRFNTKKKKTNKLVLIIQLSIN